MAQASGTRPHSLKPLPNTAMSFSSHNSLCGCRLCVGKAQPCPAFRLLDRVTAKGQFEIFSNVHFRTSASVKFAAPSKRYCGNREGMLREPSLQLHRSGLSRTADLGAYRSERRLSALNVEMCVAQHSFYKPIF